jgi:type III secretion system low calcium response chaperone LcrH/SycD
MNRDDAQPSLSAKAAAVLAHLDSGQTMSTAMGLSVKSQETLYSMAHMIYSQGKFEEAAPVFAFLVAANHLDRRFLNGAAACMHMLRRYPEALKYYVFSSLQDLTDPEPVMHSAECQLALGDRAAARQSLDYALAQARGVAAHSELAARMEAMLSFLDASPLQQEPSGESS